MKAPIDDIVDYQFGNSGYSPEPDDNVAEVELGEEELAPRLLVHFAARFFLVLECAIATLGRAQNPFRTSWLCFRARLHSSWRSTALELTVVLVCLLLTNRCIGALHEPAQ